jgi:nucleoside phosphorylase
MTPHVGRSPAAAAAAVALTPDEIARREELARYLLDPETEEEAPLAVESLDTARSLLAPQVAAAPVPPIPFPDKLRPQPQPATKPPAASARLKPADVLVVTWTVAEQNALADVLTPGYGRRTQKGKKAWYSYDRKFATDYLPQIRAGAPSRRVKRLGTWMRTRVGKQTVLCFKSELHLARDGMRDPKTGAVTLPVRDLWEQLIDEVQPGVVITTGTSGGVFEKHDLGDVAVTRAAQFHCKGAFAASPFNNKKYTNDWDVPVGHFADAVKLMNGFAKRIQEPPLLPPTKRFHPAGSPMQPPKNVPDIKLEGKKWPGQHGGPMPEFHPILTTDYFEFGTSANHLDTLGCAVEMGDAVLGLVCHERKDAPSWVVVRNLSDPVINGDLPGKGGPLPNMQTHWAVWYYQTYGYWTSVMSALTTWAIIAGL